MDFSEVKIEPFQDENRSQHAFDIYQDPEPEVYGDKQSTEIFQNNYTPHLNCNQKNQTISDERKDLKSLLPKFSQIQKSIEKLSILCPTIFTEDTIDQIYEETVNYLNLISQKQKQKSATLQKSQIQSHIQGSKSSISEVRAQKVSGKQKQTNFDEANISSPKFKDKDDFIFHLKAIIASAFCRKQKNYSQFIEQFKYSGFYVGISEGQYEKLLTEILLQAFDYLCKKVTFEAKVNIEILKSKDTVILTQILCKCQVSLSLQGCQTLFKIIKILYKIQNERIYVEETLRLYRSLLKIVKQAHFSIKNPKLYRKGEINNNIITEQMRNHKQATSRRVKRAKNEGAEYIKNGKLYTKDNVKDHFWTEVLEKQLVTQYQKRFNFATIRSNFHQKYPQFYEQITISSLKSKVFKLVRIGIRKVYYYIASYGQDLPDLVNLDDSRTKVIIYSPDSFELRSVLLGICIRNKYDEQISKDIINTINKFFEEREILMEHQSIRAKKRDQPDFTQTRQRLVSGKYAPKYNYKIKPSKDNNYSE